MIEVADGSVRVGALCPQRELERHAGALEACPLLRSPCLVGHVATRNRGTVGGSIAHADAAAELPLLLQTLGGEVEVTGPSGARFVPSQEFFVSHLTSCLEADEIVTEVRFPATGAGWGRASPRLRRATATTPCAPWPARCRSRMAASREARIGAGAVSDRPLRLRRPSGRSIGSRCEPEALAAAAGEARARSTRATACTPPPSTAGTRGRARSWRSASAPTRCGGGEKEGRRSRSKAARCTSRSTIACCSSLPARLARPRGTHVGCEHGVCGACTVLTGRAAVRSCLMLPPRPTAAHVETVEGAGRARGPAPRRSRTRSERHHALQCGFCTPGILMSAAELLASGEQRPRGARSRELLSGRPLPLHRLRDDRGRNRRDRREPRA